MVACLRRAKDRPRPKAKPDTAEPFYQRTAHRPVGTETTRSPASPRQRGRSNVRDNRKASGRPCKFGSQGVFWMKRVPQRRVNLRPMRFGSGTDLPPAAWRWRTPLRAGSWQGRNILRRRQQKSWTGAAGKRRSPSGRQLGICKKTVAMGSRRSH